MTEARAVPDTVPPEAEFSKIALKSTPKAGDIINGPLSGMEFAYIPPGTFMMGSPSDEPGRFDDEVPGLRRL